MEEAFLPTLQTLFSAPVSSPLASVNVNNVAELLVQLTNSKYLAKQGNSIDTTEVNTVESVFDDREVLHSVYLWFNFFLVVSNSVYIIYDKQFETKGSKF